MRKLLNKLTLIAMGTLVLVSCKKDEVITTTAGGTAFVVTPSSSTIVLTLAGAATDGGSFSWTKSDYGYDAVVNYKLQYDKTGNNFANMKETDLGNNLTSRLFKQSELNGQAISVGVAAGSTQDMDYRIKATIGLNALPVYSAVAKVKITTYDLVVFWYLPGDYQGWAPDNVNCPKIGSSDLTSYEGYANVPTGGTYEFKMTSDPDWNHTNYGGTATTLSTSGGNLVWPATGGYYKVNANKTTLAWSATKTTWAIIGNAPTASNNWSNDVNMTYDATNKVWKVTTALVAGELKFRANGGWGLNYGDDGANGSLEEGGANIVVSAAQAGTKTVTLDLSKPRRYTYSIN
jgi:starch-binding outer membrane protein SusE/F